jgi:TolB protein
MFVAGAIGLLLLVVPVRSTAAPIAAKNGRIVFQRLDPRRGQPRLYTIEPDGKSLRTLTAPGAADGGDSQASWSPDGRRIVFRRLSDVGQPDERVDLYVVNADGTGLRNLTRASCSGSCRTSEEPAWSPDGKRIAFSRTTETATAAPVVAIFVMNADGGHVRQLTQRRATGTEDHAPTWSPDAKRLAFMRTNITVKPAGASVIWVMNADGTHAAIVRTIAHRWRGAGAPAWSPDGKRILYTTACWFGDCGQPRTGAQLYTINAGGGGLREVTHVAGNVGRGCWSPDGKKIVFVRNARVGPTGDVYTIDADGTGLRRLTRAPALNAGDPSWGSRR